MDVDVTALVGRRAEDRWNRVCVGDLLERNVWGRPGQAAFVALPGACTEPRFARLDYRQANAVCDQLAQGFLARGLQRGDRVLLVCENSVEAVLVKLATAKAGLVAVPLNPSLAPDVLAHLVALTEPRLAVVDDELVAAVGPVLADAGVPIAITLTVTGGPLAEGSVGFGAFADAQPAVEPGGPVHGDDVYELLFTSGTTALPKGVMLSHTNATLSAHGFALSLSRGVPAEEDVRLLSFLPVVYHIGDQIFTLSVLACGGTVIVGRRPEPGAIAAAVAQERPTVLWGGSPQLVKGVTAALEAGELDAASLRVVVYGWGALEPAVLASLTARCPEVRTMGIFGQTEAIACHRFWPDRHVETYRASAPAVNYVGLPHPLLASKVVDLDGVDLAGAPGVPGEAVYRSPTVAHGYYRDPDATREAFRDGWFHSGDSCAYDADGLRVMVDRYKDIIKTGGENVSSLRVESVLHQHPAVAQAAVIGLPHDRWGEAVTAVVVPAPGAAVDADEVIAFARERLAGFETPKAVVVIDALPVTVGGKVLKYRLRAAHADLYGAPAS